MAVDLIYVGGGKGGVGKSLVSMAIIDWLIARERSVALAESDVANPDVHKSYAKVIPSTTVQLDEADGWLSLADFIHENTDATIIVNSGARVIEGIRAYGEHLNEWEREGQANLTVVWPINRLRDSVIALKQFRAVVSAGRTAVLRNLFFGRAEKFSRWDQSDFARRMMASGTRVGDLHELPDRIIDRIYDDRMSIAELLNSGHMGERSATNLWRTKTHSMLDELL